MLLRSLANRQLSELLAKDREKQVGHAPVSLRIGMALVEGPRRRVGACAFGRGPVGEMIDERQLACGRELANRLNVLLEARVGILTEAVARACPPTRLSHEDGSDAGRKQVIDPRVFDVNNVVDSLGSMIRRLIGEDIRLTIRTAPAPAMIESDPGQVEQVLVNLVVNARDAMPNGGNVTIEIALVDVTPENADGGLELNTGRYVQLIVSDTGVGMDEATRNQVFEPFFTTKPVGTGTGLGLSTVHGIVNQSGGSIFVHSEPGQGTNFRIYLPVATEEGKEACPTSSGDHPRSVTLSGELVLVVEDDSALRSLMTLMLENLGYNVIVAANGDEALTLVEIQGVRPEVVLTDVVMPGMNGWELAERLRKTVPAMPIVFMSGYTHEIIVHHGVAEADLEFIQKPFGISDLADKLTKVFTLRA